MEQNVWKKGLESWRRAGERAVGKERKDRLCDERERKKERDKEKEKTRKK